MGLVLLASLVSFIVAFTSIPVVIKIADAKKLFDLPDERKIHFIPIPSLGGVGIFAAMMLSVSTLVSFPETPGLQYFLGAAVIIFFLGLKDDILLISPMKKFAGQLIAAFLLVYPGHFQLTSLHGFLGLTALNPVFSMLFSYTTILVVMNAFNLIDGVDGLAGTLGLVSTLFFGVVFAIENDFAYAILAFSMAASLLAFLLYNYSPAKVFMGDTGSLLLGLVNAVLVIRFINTASLSGTVLQFSAAPAIGFAALFVPLMDTLRVTVLRVYQGRSPFDPDVNHIHHLLMKRGLSHMQITGLLGLMAMGYIAFSILIQSMGINFVIAGLFLIGTAISGYCTFMSMPSSKTVKKFSTSPSARDNEPTIILKNIPSTPELNN
ncbi:MAG: undecaprenyl/decaprenyl-phosphate alpha-N-acetylglucosaminyl 1-phosphate transferase [Chitinophagaceae bacterium]|jgi:UDP-N-acetylmuramyl pentapeptide phosphotransferase/UDP-N-acetylglucosamine-1-phosphate transferase|nr:undecaprenyl/decaprenyl-phosphate alpha-N-acetylglucosaminyl 1-phosphate transferase [Chitinophagaceae bacterium]